MKGRRIFGKRTDRLFIRSEFPIFRLGEVDEALKMINRLGGQQ